MIPADHLRRLLQEYRPVNCVFIGPIGTLRTPFFELGEETLLIDFADLKEAEGCITVLGQRVRQARFSNALTSLLHPHAPQQLAQSCVLA